MTKTAYNQYYFPVFTFNQKLFSKNICNSAIKIIITATPKNPPNAINLVLYHSPKNAIANIPTTAVKAVHIIILRCQVYTKYPIFLIDIIRSCSSIFSSLSLPLDIVKFSDILTATFLLNIAVNSHSNYIIICTVPAIYLSGLISVYFVSRYKY